jgi:hypothetical protein
MHTKTNTNTNTNSTGSQPQPTFLSIPSLIYPDTLLPTLPSAIKSEYNPLPIHHYEQCFQTKTDKTDKLPDKLQSFKAREREIDENLILNNKMGQQGDDDIECMNEESEQTLQTKKLSLDWIRSSELDCLDVTCLSRYGYFALNLRVERNVLLLIQLMLFNYAIAALSYGI